MLVEVSLHGYVGVEKRGRENESEVLLHEVVVEVSCLVERERKRRKGKV